MLVGDIYGGRDYSNIGLSATTIASSFGKVRVSACLKRHLPQSMHRVNVDTEHSGKIFLTGCDTASSLGTRLQQLPRMLCVAMCVPSQP